MALTLPYPGEPSRLVVAAYRNGEGRRTDAPMRVSLRFIGIGAGRLRIGLAAPQALGSVLVISNGIVACRPYVGTLQPFIERRFTGASVPHAVDMDGSQVGTVRAFSAQVETAVFRQECTLNARARRYDFSTYRLEVLSGYRFLEGTGGTQFIPSDAQLRPIENYVVRLDDAIEEARFEGGTSISDEPTARQLTGEASGVMVAWKDPHLATFREFALFILAGAFALGISMLIELVKPRFLDDPRGTSP
ncbi:MAG: hypothetical protein JO060_03215 [Candidatus Eremiobacteraeota bacterium]|nr:hypothetical protein [Candidatus Eremiobacteraeota bacterium]